jgi:hypothetical protein
MFDGGELQERRLQHCEEAEKFYRNLAAQGIKVRVGMEASGHGKPLDVALAKAVADQAVLFSVHAGCGHHWLRANVRSPEGRLLLVGNPIHLNF